MSVQMLPPGGGRRFGPGISVKVDAGAGADFAVFESALPPAWDGPPPHVHEVYDEAFYVLDGTVSFPVTARCTSVLRGETHRGVDGGRRGSVPSISKILPNARSPTPRGVPGRVHHDHHPATATERPEIPANARSRTPRGAPGRVHHDHDAGGHSPLGGQEPA